MSRDDRMMTTAMSAEARAAAVWADDSKSAQEKQAAAWQAVCARQQSVDAERRAF